jgi:hypothetical protein
LRVPYYFWRKHPNSQKYGVLYFNPEQELMERSTAHLGPENLGHFYHDLESLDPRHIGLLNLALDRTAIFTHKAAAFQYIENVTEAQPDVMMRSCLF